jgi:hypothetical protein
MEKDTSGATDRSPFARIRHLHQALQQSDDAPPPARPQPRD